MTGQELMDTGKYGEPWRWGQYSPGDGTDAGVRDRFNNFAVYGPTNARRIIACVNALAGVERPEAIGELIGAVAEFQKCQGCQNNALRIRLIAAFESLGYRGGEA